MAMVCWTWLSWGVQEGMGLSVLGHSHGDSFCLCLSGHVQGLWGSGRDACVLRPQGDLYKVLKVPSFPEKLLQFSLKVGHVDSTPSLGVSQNHPQTPLNSLSKSRGHSSGFSVSSRLMSDSHSCLWPLFMALLSSEKVFLGTHSSDRSLFLINEE